MCTMPTAGRFSSAYKERKQGPVTVREQNSLLEMELQAMWRHASFPEALATLEGHALRILAPGWWNRLGGPDFSNAQIEFNGATCTGDVEIHRCVRDWYDHGHHRDPAYNRVLLHVVQRPPADGASAAVTESGRAVATLVWPEKLVEPPRNDKKSVLPERCGECAASLNMRRPDAFRRFLGLAGEWRILEKMRRIRERTSRVGGDQALYESFMTACGYSNFKEQFLRIARTLPYDRARELARQEPLALEAALFRIGGLLPEPWPHDTPPPAHYKRIRRFREEYVPGLATLPLGWPRAGSRPANSPERRLAGAARLMMRTAEKGMYRNLDMVWRLPMTPIQRRRALEALFGGATGFWAGHYAWHGKPAAKCSAPMGAGRIRAIIGNVFIPAALAWARLEKDCVLEEHVHELFLVLPKEPDNYILRTMITWVGAPGRLAFQHQQGLLQIYEDWCARNPSCRNCTLLGYLRALDISDPAP